MSHSMLWTALFLPQTVLHSKLDPTCRIRGLGCDSRKIASGDLFFAIPGTQRDAHDYVADVVSSGGYAVVEKKTYFDQSPNTILVPNVRAAFAWACAAWFSHPSRDFSLVGITGTNGKTTTAHLCEQVWESFGLTNGRLGTVNYKVADTLLESGLTTPDAFSIQKLLSEMREQKVSHAVMEVSSIALDQDRALGTEFAGAVYTNLTQDHLDYHGNTEAYFRSKEKLFAEMNPGFAAICTEDSYGKRLMVQPYPVFTFSRLDPNADFYVHEIRCRLDGSFARVKTPVGVINLELALLGSHNLINAAGVLAVCHGLGLEVKAVAESLRHAEGAPGRLQKVDCGGKAHVFVDYAHTPDALLNVLTLLQELRGGAGGRLITVFGCGGDRDRGKRSKMAEIASTNSDVCIATSDNPRTEDPDRILDDVEKGIQKDASRYVREVDRRRAIDTALKMAGPKDIVLIAGKGHETYQILGTKKINFDDAQVVRDYYHI